MFFFLSKILDFLISPFTYLYLIVLGALFLKKHRLKLLRVLAVFIFIFGNMFLVQEAIRLWEPKSTFSADTNYDYGIVLSGMLMYDAQNDIVRFNSNADRFLQTLPLVHNGTIKQLVFTGGSGDINHPENKESLIFADFLQKTALKNTPILYESNSRNTYENAVNTIELLDSLDNNWRTKKILLITSAGHMRRSLATFNYQQIMPDYFCTNRYAGARKYEFKHCLIPQAAAFGVWTHLFHEMVGLVVYKLTGKA